MISVKERFIRYSKFDTQSDFNSKTAPSTLKQLELSKTLLEECRTMGLNNPRMNEQGYVMAELPSNLDKDTPVVGFIAHMDTSPDFSGKNVQPVSVKNYDGKDILLKDNATILSANEFPVLKNYIGNELLVTTGETLLGADDKAGIAEILTAMEYLLKNPDIKHGKVVVAFTPDEEIGRGANFFDVKDFGADFAYTLDGSELGQLEFESFNAARAEIIIKGKSVHPGTAKGIMKNAAQILVEIATMFPENETPATTEKMEGYFHLTSISGGVAKATAEYMIRDFDTDNFEKRKAFLTSVVAKINEKYDNVGIVKIKDEYYNMKNKLQDKTYIIDLARQAMEESGVSVKVSSIRGGTDGSLLSYMGLPCPNIFTGGHNYHGPYEFIPVESMLKATEVVVKIAELLAKR